GFATVTLNIDYLKSQLEENFTIVNSARDQLTAHLKANSPLEDAIIHLLAKAVKDEVIIKGLTLPLKRLTPEIAKKGLTVVDYMIATLKDKHKAPRAGKDALSAWIQVCQEPQDEYTAIDRAGKTG
ncbi:hypothetical protein B0T10DRAFT_467966, partial [Thelonectria olida]